MLLLSTGQVQADFDLRVLSKGIYYSKKISSSQNLQQKQAGQAGTSIRKIDIGQEIRL
jgi:hypothetical protein